MEGFFENSNYKSGWKHISKEDNINVIKTKPEMSNINTSNGKKSIDANSTSENNSKPNTVLKKEDSSNAVDTNHDLETNNNDENDTKPAEISMPEQEDIMNELAKISTDIDAINSMILSQNEKIDNLINLLEKKDIISKKSVFGLSWK
ncbi:MAG: hypothetical protein LKJ25_11655 [Clostridia bacterium]|jgi:hypothetical protein|nr:hypothetical protein [Clostridia bacterium]